MPTTGTVQVEMPNMGESVSEGVVLEWHVAEGDFVAEGDTIVEVSTDKVDAEVPAPASGTITKLLVEPDDVVKVGEALAEMEPGDEQGAGARSKELPSRTVPARTRAQRRTSHAGEGGEGDADIGEGDARGNFRSPRRRGLRPDDDDAEPGETIDVSMPEMGESVTEGTVLEWHKAAGDSIEEGETLIEVSTDKVDAEVPSPASGTVTELLVEPDDVVKVGQALARIEVGGSGAARQEAVSRRVRGRRSRAIRKRRRRPKSTPMRRHRRSPSASPPPRASTSPSSRAPAPAAR